MKTKARGILSASLALVMVLALMAPAVSALEFSVGDELVGGEVTAFENKTLGTGLTLQTTYTDAGDRTQAMYALGSIPKRPTLRGRLQPLDGTGATTLLGGQNLETQFGAEVAPRQR
ncbi:MAG: hypothetical protein ACLUFV_02930 [Acutalibacteraceae bacterium]